MTARTVAITGATSGLGQAVAVHLAKAGSRVLAIGRDAARAEETKALGGERVEIVLGDVGTAAGARAVAEAVAARCERLDVLVNNAGGQFDTAADTADGVERTFGLNVIGPAVLTEALLPRLSAARGRVVYVATGMLDWFAFDPGELEHPKNYDAMGQYARCKTAEIMVAVEHAERFRGDGVTVVSMTPGIVMGTRFGGGQSALTQRWMGPVLRLVGMACTLEEAVRRYEVAMNGADVPTGSYLAKGLPVALPKAAQDPATRAKVLATIAAVLQRGPAPER